jgi:HSP90 family molecular chaperone
VPEILKTYNFELPVSVRAHIRATGYVFKDMSLTLNQPRVTSLLMGERLYAQPAVAVRELLQNSIDACAARSDLEGKGYHPEISLTLVDDKFGRWIEVADNGLGMDEHVLSEYFLKLGNSYYDSAEFDRLARKSREMESFVPISRFGIGILSVYIIGDVLEVYTKAAHSPRHDSLSRYLRIEKLGALAFVTESQGGEIGTRVRVKLRHRYAHVGGQFLVTLPNYLKLVVARPRFPVRVDISESHFTLRNQSGIRLRDNAKEVLSARGRASDP